MANDVWNRRIERRQALAWLGSVGALAVGGCGGVNVTTAATGSGGTSGSGSTTGNTGSTSGSTSTGSSTGWASGGTAAMSGNYADPFTSGLGSVCALTCAQTLGPCYAQTLVRQDISEGYPGLPVRLALLVVDESCNPVQGATVDIWHTRNSGLYSGSDASMMCTNGDADAKSHRYFRGVQTSDAKGRIDFNTCYPGWYSSRAVHIHFTVRIGGQEYVTAQLFFPESLTTELFMAHADYSKFGEPDTTNSTDKVYTNAAQLVSIAKQADGALLAWKALVVRSSLTTSLCQG